MEVSIVDRLSANRATTVLVVDDNEDAADSLAILLHQQGGYATSTAYSGRQACECFDRARPMAVLLDLGLPDISGLDVAKQLRAIAGRAVALIAVTGWGREVDRTECLAAGFDAFLLKPVSFHDLAGTLDRLMGHAARN